MASPVFNHRIRRFWLFGSIVLLLSLFYQADTWSTETVAETGQPPSPIRFWADKSIIYMKANRAVLIGHVKVTQGDTTATADKMTIFFKTDGENSQQQQGLDMNKIERIELQDQVRIEFDNNVAVSQKAVYYSAQRKLVLSGPGTKITSDRNELSCSTVTYYRNDSRMECTSDGEGQVKAIIHSSGSGLN